MIPPLPPLPVPVPELPLIALLKPIWIGISPHSYDVCRARATSKNALHLNRNESAGNNTNESDVVIANSQDADVATRTSVQNTTVIVVGVKGVVLARDHDVRAQSENGVAVDTKNRGSSVVSRIVHDIALKVARERSRAVNKLVWNSAVGRAALTRATNIWDVDGVAVDYGEGAARLKLLICHYLPNGNCRFKESRRRPQPQSLSPDSLSTTYLTPVALVTFSTASPKPFMPLS